MSTRLFRVTAGAVPAIIASFVLAGAPADGSPSVASTPAGGSPPVAAAAGAAESSNLREVGATVMEEIVVYGKAAALTIDHEQLQAGIREQARILNERLKASIEKELRRLVKPRIELADGDDERLEADGDDRRLEAGGGDRRPEDGGDEGLAVRLPPA